MNRINNFNTVYLVTNTIDNKQYVGQTWKPMQDRWSGHCYLSDKHCIKLQNAIAKYSKDNFILELLSQTSSQEVANYLEISYIQEYDTIKNGYNIREGDSRGKISEETKKKISLANKGKIRTEEQKKNMSIGQTGKKYSKERNEKISASLTGKLGRRAGKKNSEEHNLALLKANIGRSGGMLGKVHSEETKQKMSKAAKGKPKPPRSEEWRKKQSAAQKGKIWKIVDGKRIRFKP